MLVARLIIAMLLLVMIVFTYSPRAQEGLSQAWVEARPLVVEIMDSLYATVRNFVAGSEPREGIDDAPPVNFDVIITMDGGFSL
jgi:hypothetical protein